MNSLFEVWSPDEVAECLEGVSSVPGLSQALWELVDNYDNMPRSEVNDDFEERALSNWWDDLSQEYQDILNDLAEKMQD